MPFVSHRSAAARTFDCIYDPNYTVPSEKDEQQASLSALSNAATVQIFPKYDAMFEDAPKATRMTYRKQLNELPHHGIKRSTKRVNLESYLSVEPGVSRLRGGANNPAERKVEYTSTSPSECKRKAPGLFFFPPTPNVNVIDVKLSDSKTKEMSGQAIRHNECRYYGDPPKSKRIKTRGTQTLYRESSAQTLPYLPGTAQDKKELENFEVFKLPDILPGDGPPGLYEVEVLERARKRWSFSKALKENFQRQLDEAKEKAKQPRHRNILEAFEWEKWIEREEYIQECQMMRLDLVIRMFDQREKEMHEASKSRIELSYEKILAKRDAALLRNEKEYGRAIRRLDKKHRHVSRNWRKENITKELGNASSEFYAPQMRYGVNPSRRSFHPGDRKSFTLAMDDLEKHAVNMNNLVCPFAKLKEWSKPKGRLMEVEQNFCSDDNLKKLYESLKKLRAQSAKQKSIPKCLIEKVPKPKYDPPFVGPSYQRVSITDPSFKIRESMLQEEEKRKSQLEELERKDFEELRSQSTNVQKRLQRLINEKRLEEIEGMVASYEGTTIGWLMRFLSEEMGRLQELRRMHFIIMLAQKERWRREAAEAGLRQKENDMREIYEELYQSTSEANAEVCQQYLDNILTVDIRDLADEKATNNVTKLAMDIDRDIERWLKSFLLIQNPLNFEMLRFLLRDLIFPDVEELLQHYEAQLVTNYIVNDVLFGVIWEALEPFDISLAIADDMVDRLIDNDLYIFTPECRSQCDCSTCCFCQPQKCEAKAILRKVIRYAVPGRRWKTSTERIAHENITDIMGDIFTTMANEGRLTLPFVGSSTHPTLKKAHSCINLVTPKQYPEMYIQCSSSDSFRSAVVKDLKRHTRATEGDGVSDDGGKQPPRVITSKYDILTPDDVKQWRVITSKYDILGPGEIAGPLKGLEGSLVTNMNILFDEGNLESLKTTTYRFLQNIINEVIRTIIPPDDGEGEDEESIFSLESYPSSFEYQTSILVVDDENENQDNVEVTENIIKADSEADLQFIMEGAVADAEAEAETQIVGDDNPPISDVILATKTEETPTENILEETPTENILEETPTENILEETPTENKLENSAAVADIETIPAKEEKTEVVIDSPPEDIHTEVVIEDPPTSTANEQQLQPEELQQAEDQPATPELPEEEPAVLPEEMTEAEPTN